MKTNSNLFIQLWMFPILKEGVLALLSPENLHTFIGLCAYMDKTGRCSPSLVTLKHTLGLKDIGSVSRRIKNLEQIKFEGSPVLKVQRTREKNSKGLLVYARNGYLLNQSIASIFALNINTSVRRVEQMKKVAEERSNFAKSFGFYAKRER